MARHHRHWWLWAAIFIVITAVGIVWYVMADVTKWLPRAIVYAPNTDKIINPAADPGPDRLRALGIDRQLRVDVGPPAASLSLWILEPHVEGLSATNKLRGTILVLHGVQDKKSSMIWIGRLLAAAGYRAVLVDLRGHGRSSGQWLTYGVLESRDLSQVIEALNRQGLLAGPVGAFGASYGGATAIMLASIDRRVKSVVAVAPYASMTEEVKLYVQHTILGRFMSDAQIDAGMSAAGRLADFDPNAASPVDAIARTKARVLLIHGREDKKIPFQQSEALHSAAPGHSELMILDRANHDSIFRERTDALGHATLTWFAGSLGQP